MMEAVHTSETSVDNNFTRQYNPEGNSEHHTRRRENLKSHKVNLYEEATLRCIRRFTHPWWWRQHAPLKHRSTIILHGSISQKTTLIIVLAAVRTWNLTKYLHASFWYRTRILVVFRDNFSSFINLARDSVSVTPCTQSIQPTLNYRDWRSKG
jgi:hypothetical protein